MKKLLLSILSVCILSAAAQARTVDVTAAYTGASHFTKADAGATVAFSVGAVLFRGRYSGLPVLPVNFWMSICAMVCFAPAAWQSPVTPLTVTLPALLALAWLTVVSLVRMALWLLLIRTQGASTAAAYNMLNPVSGLTLSALLLGAPILAGDLVGAAAIVTGLGVALGARPQTR